MYISPSEIRPRIRGVVEEVDAHAVDGDRVRLINGQRGQKTKLLDNWKMSGLVLCKMLGRVNGKILDNRSMVKGRKQRRKAWSVMFTVAIQGLAYLIGLFRSPLPYSGAPSL